jgi:RNA polymerase sigma-70 factor (ECF subfamily)
MAIAGPVRTASISDHDPRRVFTSLYEEHREAALQLLYRLTGSWSAAEDALHQAFATLYARQAELDLTKSPRNLLLTVAVNFARREYRDGKRMPPPERSRPGPSPRAARVEELIGQLSPDERAIVVLHYYEHFPYADIAELLAMPVGTVKWKMHEALARIRSGLEKLADEM